MLSSQGFKEVEFWQTEDYLTKDEITFCKDNWGEFFPELENGHGYYLQRFISLLNNDAHTLDKIKTNNYDIFYWMRNFEDFKNIADTATISELEVHQKNLSERVLMAKEAISKRLIATNHISLLESPIHLYYKIYLKVVEYVERHILNQWKEITDNKDKLTKLEVTFNFNIKTLCLEPKMPIQNDDIWLDLPLARHYFDREHYDTSLEIVKSLPFIKNRNESVIYLNTKLDALLPTEVAEFNQLQILIIHYHQIDKSNKKFLEQRIAGLKAIIDKTLLLQNHKDIQPKQSSTLKDIARIAANKLGYLKALMEVEHKVAKRIFRFEHVKGTPLIVDKSDWFSDLDPAHRKPNQNLFNTWMQECEKGPTPNFWLWMEKLPNNQFEMTRDQRYSVPKSEKRVIIINGQCYNQRCSERADGLIADGGYLYNIDRNGELYILPSPEDFISVGKVCESLKGKGVKENVAYNHNSILNGESVLMAGCITFVQGKVVNIDTNSGHYKPNIKQLKTVIQQHLLDKNIFTKEAEVTDYHGSISVSVTEFAKADFDVTIFKESTNKLSSEEVQQYNQKVQHFLNAHPATAKSNKLNRWLKSINELNKSGQLEQNQTPNSAKEIKLKIG